MRWKPAMLAIVMFAGVTVEAWAAGGGCNDGVNEWDFTTITAGGYKNGLKLLGFTLRTCPVALQTFSIIVDDLALDPSGDGVITVSPEPGITVDYEQSQPILEAMGLLRSKAVTGSGAGISYFDEGPCFPLPANNLPDYVLLANLTLVPYLDICPGP